ncbi:unnamed protein product [Durusdinium trenchii]|uniref:Uncharacterized protein n=1 Tax=Durusdinium trenchii TaxID=1381693 RepID=A0ABP0RZ44_9DINO
MGGEDEATHAAQTRRSVDLGESVDYEKMLAEAAQVPSFTPLPGSISQSEHEVQMASLEVRLRQHCLDIIGPTVRRTAALEKEVVKIQEDLQIKSTHISDLLLTAGKVEQQVANIENFRSELAKYDSERKQWQATATDSLSCMKQDLDVFRYELERMDAYVQGAQRTVDRVVGELGRVQDIGDALRADTNKRLCQQNKMLNVFKTDLEVKLVSVENRYNKLSDDLWSEETGLAKVMHDLSRTNEVVTSMSTEFSSMKHIKASIAQLEKVQEEVNNFTLETSNNVTALQQTVDRMMSDMKEHFQTATNTVAAHNAAMLQEVRTAYQEELHEAAQVRQKVDEFMQSEREYRRALEESICGIGLFASEELHTVPMGFIVAGASQAQTEDLVRQVTSEVEEVGKLRRRDRNSQEVEIKGVAKQLAIVQESSQHVANSLEHLSRVMWTMVQCERAASALDLQDDQDRAKIALMGYKEEGPGEVELLRPNQLSRRKTYNRSDLLGVREKMLLQVHESLEHGPVSFDRADIFGQTNAAPISSGRFSAL